MNTVKCGIGDCPSVFQTEEAVSPNARFVCKLHNKTEQKLFFQEDQFDKGLRIAKKPQGTSHINNQGSDVRTAEQIESVYHMWRRDPNE